MLITKKARIYIDDQVVPSPARNVRMVLDFLTDENIIKFPVKETYFEDMEIYGVNRDWNLPFLEENGNILINLGDLDQWIGLPDENGLKHVKLDIKFVLVNPNFDLFRFNRGYIGMIEISKADEIELHITLPLGMKMHGKRHLSKIKLSSEKCEKFISLSESSILDKDRRRRYDFLIPSNEIKSILNPSSTTDIFKLEYKVVNESEYYAISVIGIGLFIYALGRMMEMILNGANIIFDVRFLAAAVAFLSLYVTMLREKYEMPFRNLFVYMTVLIGIELLLELLWGD